MNVVPVKKWGAAIVALSMLLLPVKSNAIDWDDAGGSASKLWSDLGNWNPDGDPSSLDVSIGNLLGAFDDTTLVDAVFGIDSLTISNGADVVNSTDSGATNDFELLVNGDTTVSGAGSSIIIYGGAADGLDTDNLTISSGASLILDSTSNSGTSIVEIDGGTANGLLQISSGGSVTGTGQIDLEGPSAADTVLFNDGSITANTTGFLFQTPAAGTLLIQVDGGNAANAFFDWDGAGDGELYANGNQTLDIDVNPGGDAFSGAMNLSTGATIDIADAWSLDTGTINANTAAFGFVIIGQDPTPGPAAHIAGGSWTMSGGTIHLADAWDSLSFDSPITTTGGTIANSGTIVFDNAATIGAGTDFQMNGAAASITVNDGVTVNIADADFNADGIGFSTNLITIGDGAILELDLDFLIADEDINGDVLLTGGELIVNDTGATAGANWRIEVGSTVTVEDGLNTSDLDGSDLEVFGSINVNVNADLFVNPASVAFRGSASIHVAAGGTLNVSGPSSYESGVTFTGDGTFSPGTATIGVDASDTEDVIWSTAFVNYDDGDHTINSGSSLTISADSIESDGSGDGIDNATTIEEDGLLSLNLTSNAAVVFDSPAEITYNGDAAQSTFLGASGSSIEFHGTMNINGDGKVEPRFDFDGAIVNINDLGERFRMSGGSQIVGDTNTINNSTINGPGTLELDDDTALRGNGTINAVINDNGAADLIAEGGTLTLGGSILDIGRLGANGPTAVLNVTNPWSTSATNQVRLTQGRIQGANIFNDGTGGIQGEGTVTARVNNDTLISANSGGSLIMDNSLNDWDGPGNAGTLFAISASTLELRDNTAFLFNGTVEADKATVFANGFELEFDPGSTLELNNGGVYRSTNATDIGGTVLVGAGADTMINVAGTVVFESGSSTTLTGSLVVSNPNTVVQSGAVFAGGGSLINPAGQTLRLLDGASVGVLIENRGALVLGVSAGQATGSNFEQFATGSLEIQLGGTGLNDYDRFLLTGAAQLAGTLDVSFIGGFSPVINDTFTILAAPGSILSTFSAEDFTAAPLGAGLFWDVVYNPTNVQLVVAAVLSLDCDADFDGDCEQDDINAMYASFGGGGQFDYDSSGTVDAMDIGGWLADASSPNNTYNVSSHTFVIGDANLDGSVDSADLGLLLNNFLSVANIDWLDGNMNGDGIVDSADLGQLLNNFGFTSAAANAVPEPSTLMLIGWGLAVLRLRRSISNPAEAILKPAGSWPTN